jgi:hypothetical protein
MYVEIPHVRVGEPMQCGGMTVFPLATGLPMFQYDEGLPEYVLAHEAMAAGTLIVREVSEEGSVCELLADNLGDQRVLFVEGEELKGAKQNRAVATSVMVAGRSCARLPVCCIQRGKWEYSSRQFSPGSYCPPTLRHLLKRGADGIAVVQRQQAVWQEVRRKHQATATRSEKENLSDALETHRDRVDNMRCRLRYPEGKSGIAVALGGRFVEIDLFHKPSTLEHLWDRLVEGVALDALEFGDTGCQADGNEIAVRLYRLKDVEWKRIEPAIGLGEAYRVREDDGSLATALFVDGVPVHMSVSVSAIG